MCMWKKGCSSLVYSKTGENRNEEEKGQEWFTVETMGFNQQVKDTNGEDTSCCPSDPGQVTHPLWLSTSLAVQ